MKVRRASLMLVLPVLLASSTAAQTRPPVAKAAGSAGYVSADGKQAWRVDTSHSELTFSIRHFTSRVQGRFRAWSGTITMSAADWSHAAVNVVIKASSIDTKNEQRDKHLRSNDFFDVERYPEITFKSADVKRHGDSIVVAGTLTMKGVTKPVVLTGKLTREASGSKPLLEFQATTTINRLDYGVSYNRVIEGGGATLGDEVTVDIILTAVPGE